MLALRRLASLILAAALMARALTAQTPLSSMTTDELVDGLRDTNRTSRAASMAELRRRGATVSSPTSDYTESPGRIARFGYPAWGLTSGPHHWELACSSLGEPACVRMGYPRAAQTLPGVGALEDRHRSAAGCQSPGDLPLDPDWAARS